jgi:hypothetical protein
LTLRAAVQQAALTWVLRRRIGFAVPGRAYAAWITLSLAGLTAAFFDPGRATGAVLAIAFALVFALLGRVTPAGSRAAAEAPVAG